MKIENQVCSLEQAKKLKKLGIVQDGYFCFIGDDNPDLKYNTPYSLFTDSIARTDIGAGWYEHRIAAFTSSELAEMLPSKIKAREMNFELNISKDSSGWTISYWWDEDSRHISGAFIYTTSGINEADAYASTLIYLLENEIIEVKNCNNCLLAE